MSNPRNETYDLAGECNSIFDEYDVITREQGDAVYDDGLVWHVKGISITSKDVEYILENRDRSEDRDYVFHPAVVSPDPVECPLCDEACKHTYHDNSVNCKNESCCMMKFDAKKYLDNTE